MEVRQFAGEGELISMVFRIGPGASRFSFDTKALSISVPVWFVVWVPVKVKSSENSLTTQPALDDERMTDELLNQILDTYRHTPNPSQERCNAYIHKLCKAGNLSMAIRLLRSLRDRNIFIPIAYNTLLAAVAERNQIDLSFQIFDDLLVFYRHLNSAYYLNLARSCDNTNDCTALIRYVKRVSELAFPDNTIVMNRIIFAFGKCRQIELALFRI
ncbi:Tetratricopeptide repeat (TPR)-like superfamily protein, putative isoform 3 [Hibiscus syriacus]|uniref:Tetratricopeptide repeat (TPR)-like superfamily protein, putative isoform 3 n=1 Tax=Hibiscus syriacus TaxID=106335 RepID=A0A6A2WGT4_HIBSY|nr:Tetratricopeptide repeat (TPR)-like superfamily protein, putative isoform 3 [Hibiscus syriacus]